MFTKMFTGQKEGVGIHFQPLEIMEPMSGIEPLTC